MKQQLLEQSCTYWSLTPEERQEVIDTTPKLPTWELQLKRRDDGYWFFDYPELKTAHELLIGGIEKMLDHYYIQQSQALPDEFSEMTAIVSTEELEEATAILLKTQDDKAVKDAAFYIDVATGIEGWLCPWTQTIWGNSPPQINCLLLPTA